MILRASAVSTATTACALSFLCAQAAAFTPLGDVSHMKFLSSSKLVPTTPLTSTNKRLKTTSLHVFEVLSEINTMAQTTTTQAMSSAASATTAAAIVGSAPSTASSSITSAINSFFQTQPYLAAFLTCSFKASAADMVAQTQEESQTTQQQQQQQQPKFSSLKSLNTDQMDNENNNGIFLMDNDVDLSRNLGFLLYGGLYQGMAQNYLYSVVYPALVGSGDGWEITTTKVIIDNLIFAPFLCLPVAYIFKTAFTSEEPFYANMSGTFTQSMEKYYKDVMQNGLLVKYWSLWIPVQFLTFGVIPEHFRVAFVAFISFFWICVLSTVVSSNTPPVSEQKDSSI